MLLLVGDGAAPVAVHLGQLAEEAGVPVDIELGGPDTAQPTAADLALVALQRVEDGEVGGTDLLRPLYLREADARIGWEERGRLRGGASS